VLDIQAVVNDVLARSEAEDDVPQFMLNETRSMSRESVDMLASAYLISELRSRRPKPARASTPRPKATPEQEARFAQIQREIELTAEQKQAEFIRSMSTAFTKLKAAWHIEWTDELLNSTVQLADGSTIAFGDATREQHIARATIHRRNTALNMEAAVRHEKAVEALNETGASTLREALR
jgi:hypothetical protein